MCVEEIWDFIFRAHQRPGFCDALYFAYRILFLGHSGPRRSSQFAFKQMLPPTLETLHPQLLMQPFVRWVMGRNPVELSTDRLLSGPIKSLNQPPSILLNGK